LLTTNARRPIKGFKDAYFRLTFFAKKQKLPLWVGTQGPVTRAGLKPVQPMQLHWVPHL